MAFTSHKSPQRTPPPPPPRRASPPPRRRAPPPAHRAFRGLASLSAEDATTTNNDPLPPGVLPPSKKQIRLEDAGNATFRAYAKVDLGEQAQLLVRRGL